MIIVHIAVQKQRNCQKGILNTADEISFILEERKMYKGIDTTTGKWVYGEIYPHNEQRFILSVDGYIHEVRPDTIIVCEDENNG